LIWELRSDGGEGCIDGPITLGGEHTLGSSAGWQRPAQPARVDVSPVAWTANTSITVILVVYPNAVGTFNGVFDRITLEVKDWFTRDGADFNTTPVVFRHKGQDHLAVTGNDGRVYLLDGASLGGADHKTPLFASDAFAPPNAGAGLATWQDADGTRWVLAPAGNGIVAMKVVDKDGKAALEARWRSPAIAAPLAPIVVNGVVFAAASGEYRGTEPNLSAAERAKRSTPAVLYALDAATGKQLWTSGTTITSFARGGLAAGGGQVYLVTYDNTLYAFGIPLEH
jgi:hypothetical protein